MKIALFAVAVICTIIGTLLLITYLHLVVNKVPLSQYKLEKRHNGEPFKKHHFLMEAIIMFLLASYLFRTASTWGA